MGKGSPLRAGFIPISDQITTIAKISCSRSGGVYPLLESYLVKAKLHILAHHFGQIWGLELMNKAFYGIALIGFLIPSVSIAQDNAADQELIKAGYLLSVESVRLNALRNEIAEIKRKKLVLSDNNNRQICHINMLLENLFLTATICNYESILLNAFAGMQDGQKVEQYRLHHSRLKQDTLRKLYVNFQSTLSNFTNIDDQEILELSDAVKEDMLKVLSLIEEVIDNMQDQIRDIP